MAAVQISEHIFKAMKDKVIFITGMHVFPFYRHTYRTRNVNKNQAARQESERQQQSYVSSTARM